MKRLFILGTIAVFAISCSEVKQTVSTSQKKSADELLESLVEPSDITLPVIVPLTSLVNIADLESRIPLSEDQNNSWKEIPETGSGKAIRYKLERDPFSVSAHDSILEVSTELRYQVKYAQRVKQPWPFTNYTWITIGSCGYNEPMRRIRVVLT
jgi:hypothetical protein